MTINPALIHRVVMQAKQQVQDEMLEAKAAVILDRIRRGQQLEAALALTERALVLRFVVEQQLRTASPPAQEHLIAAIKRLDAGLLELAQAVAAAEAEEKGVTLVDAEEGEAA